MDEEEKEYEVGKSTIVHLLILFTCCFLESITQARVVNEGKRGKKNLAWVRFVLRRVPL
jgi:hypothetical protein